MALNLFRSIIMGLSGCSDLQHVACITSWVVSMGYLHGLTFQFFTNHRCNQIEQRKKKMQQVFNSYNQFYQPTYFHGYSLRLYNLQYTSTFHCFHFLHLFLSVRRREYVEIFSPGHFTGFFDAQLVGLVVQFLYLRNQSSVWKCTELCRKYVSHIEWMVAQTHLQFLWSLTMHGIYVLLR